jgi:excisionase family DNA binding protein
MSNTSKHVNNRREQVEQRYASLEEAARWYGMSQRSIRRMIADGSLPAVRVGKRQIRIRIEDLEALAEPIPTAGGAA